MALDLERLGQTAPTQAHAAAGLVQARFDRRSASAQVFGDLPNFVAKAVAQVVERFAHPANRVE